MMDHESRILDRQDQTQIICGRCDATLSEYRAGRKCSAALSDPCPGFRWVEGVLANPEEPA